LPNGVDRAGRPAARDRRLPGEGAAGAVRLRHPHPPPQGGASSPPRCPVPTLCLGPDGLGPDLLAPLPEGTEPFDLDSAVGAPESIFQTTGTTGTPKLIHHGAGLYEQMSAIADDWVATGQPLLRHFSLTPMWHAAGQATAMLNLVSGGVLFILFPVHLRGVTWPPSRKHRATSVYISPLMLNALLDDPALGTTDRGSLKLLTSAARRSPRPGCARRSSASVRSFG